jgi:predicted GH43/DUF377 family glycosyl hydrolase
VLFRSESRVHQLLEQVLTEFGNRHYQMRSILLKHFELVRRWTLTDQRISEERKLLIGSYFTLEYSLESAALFNPSIVPHPDQSDLPQGSVRFLISLRATGEGHISSIVFRMGTVDSDGNIDVVPATRYVTVPDRIVHRYDKPMFIRKLRELDLENEYAMHVLNELAEAFTLDELEEQIAAIQRELPRTSDVRGTMEGIRHLALSNYEIRFDPEQRPSERAIFPHSPSQSNGIEDARFVQFVGDDGRPTYYATYTAFDGSVILPQVLETSDFLSFRFITLNGPAVRNKGMALFPRKIDGCYAMLSRQDGENLFLMYSDNVHFWHTSHVMIKPTYSWEFYQLGNCGSPIETEQGWLVLSHGVGPMRKYCIGAFLLDKHDPTRVLGRLPEPLIKPNENEREGYVPNVVYTCGAMLHGRTLVIPYALSDYATSFATVDVHDVIAAME